MGMKSFPIALGSLVLGTIFFGTPLSASAQAYVPVRDQDLITAFNGYVTTFTNTIGGTPNGTTDSLRDLISGSDPGGLAKEDCVQGDAQLLAKAYQDPNGPWARASASTSEDIPYEYPAADTYVQVNKSASLRCLLQEIVEFQKLSASTEIHQILLTYISNAQAKQVANKMSDEITAANLEFAAQGSKVISGGVEEATPLFVTNPEQARNDEGTREAKFMAEQITAAPGDDVESLGYCDSFALDAAQAAIVSAENSTQDTYDRSANMTQCGMTQPGGIFYDGTEDDYSQFMVDPNSLGTGADMGLLYFLNNPNDAKVTNLNMTVNLTEERVRDAQKEIDDMSKSSGYLPTPNNPDIPGNPEGVRKYRTYTSPAGQNQKMIERSTEAGVQQITDTTAVGQEPIEAARNLAVEINTSSGVSGYNVEKLAYPVNRVNEAIKELYNVFNTGYFDISNDTTDWARATMLMTYDEMNFNDQEPQQVIPDNTSPAASDNTDTITPAIVPGT
jgi:hypothetical protein